jgi:uncharacterized protein YraI
VAGHTTVRINVRAGPGIGFASVGLLDAKQEVQIAGRNEAGDWYLILYPAGPQGYGWVAAEYIKAAHTAALPVIPPSGPRNTPAGVSGRVTQRLNVRSGPGVSFNILGILEADTTVSLTGKNQNGTWLQIAYPEGPNGKGWVTAAYIQAEDIAALPALDDLGNPLPPGTSGPAETPTTPTPTIGPAFADHDSADSPGALVTFAPGGFQQFTFTGDVSIPEGDPEDWIAFTPYAPGDTAQVTLELACTGNGSLSVELWQGSEQMANWGELTCNAPALSILLTSQRAYLLRISPAAGDGLVYVHYALTASNEP